MTLSTVVDALVAGETDGWAISHEVSPGVIVDASRCTINDKRDGTIWRDTFVEGVLAKSELSTGASTWAVDTRAPIKATEVEEE